MAPTFPRDVFMEMFLLGAWRDVTSSVRQTDPVKITRGRSGEQGEVAPGTLTCKLENSTGNFTPSNPLGAYYGAMKKGTPTRFGLNVAKDTFTGRTVSNGWGTATTGEAWSVYTGMGSAADYAVSGGVGTQTIGTANTYRYAYLPTVSYKDVEVTATVTVAIGDVTGGAFEPANVICRHQGGSGAYYYARVSISTAEVLTISIHHSLIGQLVTPVTVPGLVSISSPKTLRAKIQAEGNTIRAKVYAPGAEPVGWHVEIHDTNITTAGYVGVRNGVGSGNTNTPVVFSVDNFEVRALRFAGEIVELKPRWNTNHSDRWAELTLSTVLRRIRQGKTPLKSSLRRGYLADAIDLPVQYWPCEEGQDAQRITSVIDGNYMTISGRPRFTQFTDFIGSAPLPKVNGSTWTGAIAAYTPTGQTQLRFLLGVPKDGIPDNTVVARLVTTGTLWKWELLYRTGGGMSLNIYNNAGTLVLTGGSIALALNGALVRVSLQLTQNGANVDWGLSGYDVITGVAGGSSGSQAGTFVIANQVVISPAGTVNDVGLGHIVVQSGNTSTFELSSEYGAWRGETPIDRADRLCGENGINPLAYIGSTSFKFMGPQLPTLLTNLLKECQDTAQGTLADSRASGNTLTFRALNATFAQTAGLTLNYAGAEIAEPFQPSDDDKPVRNDITAKRSSGGEYRVSQETGPNNAQDPGTDDDAVGRYDQQYTANVQDELQLPDIAGWELHLGVTEAERWPKLRLNLRATALSSATKQAQILDLNLDDRVTVTGMSAAGYFDDVELLLRGYTETFRDSYDHTIEFNCAPYEPYNVGIYDDAASRWDTSNSQLAASITTTATSFTVSTISGPLWTTTAGQFPMDIMIGGERIRLSAISGSSSPQTFTVASGGRSINGLVKAHTSGDAVTIAGPVYYGR